MINCFCNETENSRARQFKRKWFKQMFHTGRNLKFTLYLFCRFESHRISVLWNIIIKFLRNNRRTCSTIRNRSNVSISLHILYSASITAKTNVMVNFYELCAIGRNSTWNMRKVCSYVHNASVMFFLLDLCIEIYVISTKRL